MTTRMSGITGIFDMDALVSANLERYKTKSTNYEKEMMLYELKQEKYREVLTSTREFYNKYLTSDTTGLMHSSNYQSVSFESSNSAVVTAKGMSGTTVSNYTVKVNEIAQSAQISYLDGELKDGQKITIGGNEFTLEGADSKTIVKNLNTAISNYNSELTDTSKKIDITASYSNFVDDGTGNATTGIIIKTNTLGTDAQINVGSNSYNEISLNEELKSGDKITINDTEITLIGETESEILSNLKKSLEDSEIDVNVAFNDGKLNFVSTDKEFTVKASNEEGTTGYQSKNIMNLKLNNGDKIVINDKTIEISGSTKEERLANLQSALISNGIDLSTSVNDNGAIEFSSNLSEAFSIQKISNGKNADITITDSNGVTYTHDTNSNNVTLNNVYFTFTGKTSNGESISLVGKQDVTAIKDKIKSFIKDYNTLITDLNTKLSEKRYGAYMPLTSEEKADMTESDIKLWNEKVESGALRKDNDIQRLVSNMKNTMRTMMSDTGLSLEDIGIKPVDDYGTSNGTFEIDDTKLTAALESNMESVKELFTKSGDSTSGYYNGGVLSGLQQTFNTEVMKSSTSALIKKAGLQGSVTDEMSKQLTEMQEKLDDMNKDITTREQKLYSKYATLESTLSKLQSQQNSLMSYFGS